MSLFYRGELENWSVRAEVVAGIVKGLPYRYVCDFGCGKGSLKSLLVNQQYLGIDHPLQPGAPVGVGFLACDLNLEFPQAALLPGRRDQRVAVACGLLEYLEDVEGFLRRVAQHFAAVVFSYAAGYDPADFKYGRINQYLDFEVAAIAARCFPDVQLRCRVPEESRQIVMVGRGDAS